MSGRDVAAIAAPAAQVVMNSRLFMMNPYDFYAFF
jgi:hypothetical protein